MSLINDALQRARRAQPPTNTTPELPFQPAVSAGKEPNPWLRGALSFTTIFAVICAVMVWREYHHSDGNSTLATLNVHAETREAAATSPAVNLSADPAKLPEPVQAAAPVAAPIIMTNAAAAPAPKETSLRLQGIFYDPAAPSAMVNGHSVVVGDKVSGWRITHIERDNITVVNSGQTNILSLEQ